MPIKKENLARYPKDWKALSHAAKERAGWKCQHPGCKARQYSIGTWHRPDGGAHQWAEQYEPTTTYADARTVAAEAWWEVQHLGGDKLTIIVLTVAHLNHEPEDCRPENLAAMCQRHHLAYDAQHHKETAYSTRKAAKQTADLFAWCLTFTLIHHQKPRSDDERTTRVQRACRLNRRVDAHGAVLRTAVALVRGRIPRTDR